MTTTVATSKLALFGGEKAVRSEPGDLFSWPIVTAEHEQAVLDVLRSGRMSGLDVTMEFEKEYAAKIGRKYALACNTGTAAIHCGFFGLGVGVGDEVIAPSLTYWATVLQVMSLGATPVFAEVDPETLCINPKDIERRITPRTKAIAVVHYCGRPCEMDAILAIGRERGIPILEDVSHAHGALYKGREVGTLSEVAAMSLMSGKSFAIGEGGILFTDDQEIYERALLFGHYARHGEGLKLEKYKPYGGLPWGGYKYRMHQLSSAMGRVQLKYYYQQMAEIDRAMNYFCDLLEGTPGLRPNRPAKGSGSTMGGWYSAMIHYIPEQLGGLSGTRFAEAVRAEGSICTVGCNVPLHTHPLFSEVDVYGHGRPTRVANLPKGVKLSQPKGSLPVTESIPARVLRIPWFKHYRPAVIEQHANAYKKVAANYQELLKDDPGNPTSIGSFTSFQGLPSSRR